MKFDRTIRMAWLLLAATALVLLYRGDLSIGLDTDFLRGSFTVENGP